MPVKLVQPEMYSDLFNDQKIDINANPPDRENIKSALKSFNNGKSLRSQGGLVVIYRASHHC